MVLPGSYPVTVSLQSTLGISVQGVVGMARPVITSSATNALRLVGGGSRVAQLTLVHTGAGRALDVFSSETVERVDVRSEGSAACFIGPNNRVRDSLCVTTDSDGAAVATDANSLGVHTLRLRNVTAIATGPSGKGINAALGQDGDLVVDLRNVIASGSTVRDPQDASSVTVVAAYSNYDTVGGSGAGTMTAPGTSTNQTAPPVFADTTGYHQAAASPTVDKGAGDGHTGTTDLDGDNRQVGPAPDIGVDEYVAPQPDVTAPNTTFRKKPKKRTFSHRAKFVLASTEAGVSYVCRLDKKRAKPCTSPSKKRIRKHGKHTFRVWATDAAGNTDPTPAVWKWRIKRRPHE